MAAFRSKLAQHPIRLMKCIALRRIIHSTQSVTNTLVLRVLPLFRLEENANLLPSGENIGKESNAESNETCSSPVPSVLIMKILNGKGSSRLT